MTWMTSDIIIMALTVVLSLNLLIVLLTVAVRKILEQDLDKRHLNYLLKFILLYMPVIISFMTGYILYTRTFRGKMVADSEDFAYYYRIGKRTLSLFTNLGNYWPFVVTMCIWGIGVFYVGIIRCLKEQKFLKELAKCSLISKDKDLCDSLSTLKNELHIRNKITVYTNNLIPTPFIIGIFRIKLFMPQVSFSEQELELILKHELIHCKNNDYLFRRWIHYLCALFWFNPAIYAITDSFLDINEMACDDEVLKNKPKDTRSSYAHLIIDIAERNLPLKSAVSITGCTNNGLERRIINIMKRTNTNKKMLFCACTVIAILICPVTAAAASIGVSDLQSHITEKIISKNSIKLEMRTTPRHEERTEIISGFDKSTTLIQISPRGSSSIDCDISGKEYVTADTISLSQGTRVHFWITADNATDRFNAGLIDSNGRKTYVSSSAGEINHTFTAKTDGDYEVFVEGTTDNNIHVSGSVTVNN